MKVPSVVASVAVLVCRAYSQQLEFTGLPGGDGPWYYPDGTTLTAWSGEVTADSYNAAATASLLAIGSWAGVFWGSASDVALYRTGNPIGTVVQIYGPEIPDGGWGLAAQTGSTYTGLAGIDEGFGADWVPGSYTWSGAESGALVADGGGGGGGGGPPADIGAMAAELQSGMAPVLTLAVIMCLYVTGKKVVLSYTKIR